MKESKSHKSSYNANKVLPQECDFVGEIWIEMYSISIGLIGKNHSFGENVCEYDSESSVAANHSHNEFIAIQGITYLMFIA